MRAMWAHELTWEFVFGPSKPGGLGFNTHLRTGDKVLES